MGKQRCPSCNGTGDMVFYTRGGFGTVRDCDMCHGTGEIHIVGSKEYPSGTVKVAKMKEVTYKYGATKMVPDGEPTEKCPYCGGRGKVKLYE